MITVFHWFVYNLWVPVKVQKLQIFIEQCLTHWKASRVSKQTTGNKRSTSHHGRPSRRSLLAPNKWREKRMGTRQLKVHVQRSTWDHTLAFNQSCKSTLIYLLFSRAQQTTRNFVKGVVLRLSRQPVLKILPITCPYSQWNLSLAKKNNWQMTRSLSHVKQTSPKHYIKRNRQKEWKNFYVKKF